MDVSVIVLTYNQEDTISRALDSVLAQKTRYSYEIILGDDCSTDGTRAICEEYSVRYPEIVRLMDAHSNYGVVKHFGEAMKQCTGRYIMGCSGDDWWHNPRRIQIQVDYMDVHPGCVLCHGGYVEFLQDSGKSIERKPEIVKEPQFVHMLSSPPVNSITDCIRKEALDKINYQDFIDKEFKVEDYSIWLGLSLIGSIDALDYSLATYTLRPGSISHGSGIEEKLTFLDAVRDIQLYYVQKENLGEMYTQQVMDMYYVEKAGLYASDNQREKARNGLLSVRNKDIKIKIKIALCESSVLFPLWYRKLRRRSK